MDMQLTDQRLSSAQSRSVTYTALSLAQLLVLVGVLLIGLALRAYNIAWDSGTLPHPDERSTVAFYAPSIRWPGDVSTALDPRRSTLNPFWDVNGQHTRSYTYGHFPLYTLVLTAAAGEQLAPLAASLGLPEPLVHELADARSIEGYAYIGRFLAALADTASVLLVFVLGRRLYGTWAGLLAAAFSAFTVLQIQLAHFFAVDPISTTFTLLGLYGAIRMYDRNTAGAAVLTGVGIGLAVASKYSALPAAAAPLVAVVLAGRRPAADGQPDARRRAWRNLLLAALVSFVVFAVTSPFVFLDFGSFWRAVVEEQGNMVSGVADMPYTRQYRGTPAYLYFIEQQLRWGMGWPLGLVAFAGLAWVLGRAVLRRLSAGEWIVLSWVVLYFGPTGLFLAKFMRYMVPVAPLFVLFGAGLVASLAGGNRQTPAPPQVRVGKSANTCPIATAGHLAAGAGRQISESANQPHRGPLAPQFGSYLGLGAGAVALVGAAAWSLAFVNGVYGTPHSWVTASRWVYANVPKEACIVQEHWEEGFPRSLSEPGMYPGAYAYRQPLLPMYEEDTRQKFETIRDTLKGCDYLALASNRLWRTIPRLPERYPMSTRYYELLFGGELGFEEVYSHATPPRLGPLSVDDQAADESFTVYDHPRPIIFKKTRQLSDAEWEARLGDRWQGAVHSYVGEPTLLMRLRGWHGPDLPPATPGGDPSSAAARKSLMLDRPVDELPVVHDFRWNTAANRSAGLAILVWWLAVQLIGWLAWPLARRLFSPLADRGYLLSKGLGWLLVGYVVWLGASLRLVPNRLSTVIGALAALGAVAGWLAWRDRQAMRDFVTRHARLILAGEVLFTGVYLFFIGLRLLNPDLWQPWNGGEKMLEIGFLNAIVKSAYMPPYDPFFAGGTINYYYYGLFLVGVLVKLTGIQPTVAFNLAVPTVAALTAAGVFSLAYNLARASTRQRARALTIAALAVLLVVLVGNLAGFTQLARMLGEHGGSTFESGIPGVQGAVRALAGLKSVLLEGTQLPPYNYWDPSRVILDTINEFPYWSFLFADLHPHMIGIPFTVLFLSLAYSWLSWGLGKQQIGDWANGQMGKWANRRIGESANRRIGESANQQISKSANRQVGESGDREIGEPGSGKTGEMGNPGLAPGATDMVEEGGGPDAELPSPQGVWRRAALEVLDAWRDLSAAQLLRWLAMPFCLGALAVINTWDLPTYLGVASLVFWLVRYRRIACGAPLTGPMDGVRLAVSLLEALVFGGLTLAASYLMYRPFFAHYQPLDVGLGVVRDQTGLGQFLKIWGLPLFVGISYLLLRLLYPASRMAVLRTVSLFLMRWNVAPHLSEVYGAVVKRIGTGYWTAIWSLASIAGMTAGLWLLGYRVPALLLPPVWLAFLLVLRPDVDAGETFTGVLLFTGLLLLLGVEFVFLRDFLGGGPYYRMNTLFKFYTQVWVMLGMAAAFMMVSVYRLLWALTLGEGTGSLRWTAANLGWQVILGVLLVAALTYPALGTTTRVRDRFDDSPPVGTLDGMAYMTAGTLMWPQDNPMRLEYDYQAIRWLQEHVQGTPILAEAMVGYYREGGMRVSAYTGLPMPIGHLHQNEQRWPDQVSQREVRYMEFWNTSSPERAWQVIQELDISYIYIGQLELTLYNPNLTEVLMQWGVPFLNAEGYPKFEELAAQGRLEVVYENERTRIYQVVREQVAGSR
jgi:uncharacterized membrane protein